MKKTLFVGVFAWLISNWNNLAAIVFESFAGLGLLASGTGFSPRTSCVPRRVAQTGLDAGARFWTPPPISWLRRLLRELHPDRHACSSPGRLVLLAFFLLAVQLFVTLIEFKLMTLAGFVLIPFGLFGKTAFMAERVLGNVVSSGIKVLVLAVIIGIGSTLFGQFTAGFGGVTPTIDEAMAIVLAALSLLGLGIFGPGIATGLVSGGPQLGAGAAVGTGLAVGGAAVAAGGGAMLGARGAGALASGGATATRGPRPPRVPPPPPTVSDRWARPVRRVSPPVSVACAGRGRGGHFASAPGRRRGLRRRQGKSCRRHPRWFRRHRRLVLARQRGRRLDCHHRPRRQSTGLGAHHAPQPGHEPWRFRCHPCASRRGQSRLRRFRSPVRK